MFDEKPCCGNCEYCRQDECGDWICTNPESEDIADWVEYEYYCEEWSERE